MTERIGNLFTESVEIAITHIDSLFIVGEIHISTLSVKRFPIPVSYTHLLHHVGESSLERAFHRLGQIHAGSGKTQ